LLNEILHYTRCQTLQTTALEMNGLIQDMLEAIRSMPTAQGRQIEFIPSDPMWVLGDQDKLKQVLINLVCNACEAIEPGGRIVWTLNFCPRDRTVQIQIYNGGESIPPEVLSRLTKPFFTTKSTGNGLGLAIVKRIVEAHKGRLDIESSETIGGTRVSVILPLINPP
jgi:signal transduction histidine kinase